MNKKCSRRACHGRRSSPLNLNPKTSCAIIIIFSFCFNIFHSSLTAFVTCQNKLTFRFFFKYPLMLTCVVPVDDGDGDADDCDAVVVGGARTVSAVFVAIVGATVVDDADASCDALGCNVGPLLLFFTTNFCMFTFGLFFYYYFFFV